MNLGIRRIVAWLIDWACILGWVALTAAVGVPLYLAGVIATVSQLQLNIVGALVVVVPVVIAAAVFESSARAATPGKRVLRLRVLTSAGRPGFGVALARNALKIGAPWLIGHAAVVAIVATGTQPAVPTAVWILTALAYVVPIVYVVSLFVGSGRTPYDRVAHTIVMRSITRRTRASRRRPRSREGLL